MRRRHRNPGTARPESCCRPATLCCTCKRFCHNGSGTLSERDNYRLRAGDCSFIPPRRPNTRMRRCGYVDVRPGRHHVIGSKGFQRLPGPGGTIRASTSVASLLPGAAWPERFILLHQGRDALDSLRCWPAASSTSATKRHGQVPVADNRDAPLAGRCFPASRRTCR